MNCLTYASLSDPLYTDITVVYFSNPGAFGDRDVGAEYLSKNSLTPLRTESMQNSASFTSFPGAKNTVVPS